MHRTSRQPWIALRCGYIAALFGWFLLVAFWSGPSIFVYHRLIPPGPSDFVGFVNAECAPVLRAMAAYRRDVGQETSSYSDLVPKYLPAAPARGGLFLMRDGSVEFRRFDLLIRVRYTFADGPAHWTIEGPSLDGTVPAPPVPEYQPMDPDDNRH